VRLTRGPGKISNIRVLGRNFDSTARTHLDILLSFFFYHMQCVRGITDVVSFVYIRCVSQKYIPKLEETSYTDF
jgi:hypothetical protein